MTKQLDVDRQYLGEECHYGKAANLQKQSLCFFLIYLLLFLSHLTLIEDSPSILLITFHQKTWVL